MSSNLAVYLNLPEYFHDAGEKLSEHYYFNLKLIQMLENTPNIKKHLIKHVKLVLERMDDYGKFVKELLIIYIYIFLDKQSVIDLILSYAPFKTVVMQKLTDITNYQEYLITNPQLLEYLIQNFTMNKRFLSIKKNLEYRKRIFRIYMKTMVICRKWYDNILEKRYAPGGNGAIEAKNHFIKCISLCC
jgi:hypothetical protein